jgi:hypothetical protein
MASEKEIYASMYSMMSDFDRQEAYFPNLLTLNAMYNYANVSSDKLSLRFGIGPVLWVNTKTGSGSDKTELLLAYSLKGGIHTDAFAVSLAYSGRMIVTESGGDLSDRMFHQVGFIADAQFGRFIPGVYYRVPLDKNLKEVISGVLGVSLGIEL